MRIDSFHLRNICCHRDLRHNLSPGTTLITGRNGSGKSTILTALEVGITGNWATIGVKEDNISQLADRKDPSFIHMSVTHGDTQMNVLRSLRPNRAEVSINGGRAETGERRVNAVLEDVLGIPLDVISRILFTKQLQIARFMTERPAERAETFQFLFGTTNAARLYDLLSKELDSTPVLQGSGELEDIAGRLAEAHYRHANLTEELAGLPQADPAAAARAVTVIKAVAARRTLVQERRRLRCTVKELESQFIILRVDLIREEENRRIRDAVYESCQSTVPNVHASLQQWQKYRQLVQEKETLRRQREQVEAEAAKVFQPPPVVEAILRDAAIYDRESNDRYREIQNRRAFLSSFSGNIAECPTCGTPVTSLLPRKFVYEAELPNLVAEYNRLQAADQHVKRYQAATTSAERASASINQKLQRILGAEQSLQAVQPPVDSEEELQTFLANMSVLSQQREQQRQQNAALAVSLGRVEAVWAEHLRRYNELTELLSATRPDRKEYAAAGARSQQHAQLAAQRGALEGQLAELARSIQAYEERHTAAETAIKQAAANNAWRALVTRMRPLVHHDGLPRMVSQARLAAIQEDIQELLDEFDANFRVEILEDLSYQVRFPDGRVQPAARLSSGQKVVLALAFWVAVNASFARELGFLALDEPTESLDAVNKLCVEKAIARLRHISQSRGLQCLIVTHDRSLGRLCDDPLDLGGWG